jgi:Kef-type K+ transport system membrane component KefB
VIPLLLLLAIGGLMQAARSFTTSMGTAGTELAFGFLLLTAYFAARVVSQLGLPKLTGYLLVGVITGPYVLDLVTRDMTSSLAIVNGSATCILGLVAGSELNLRRVRPVMPTLRWLTVYAVLGEIVALAGVLFLMRPMLPMFRDATPSHAIAICVVVAVALTPQSPAVVMALLAEMRADGPLSQIMLASVVISDLVVVLCYSIVAAVVGAMIGADVDVVETSLSIVWELLGSIAFGVAVGMLIGQFLRSVKKGATLFALLVCVVVAEIGARVHLDPLVVMLAAGIWLQNFARCDASTLLHGFESAQLPVFLVWFALSGTKLDVVSLGRTLGPVLILAVVRAGWFYLGANAACRRTGATPNVQRFAWIGLVPQAGLSLALFVVIQKEFPSFGGDAATLMLSLLGVNLLLSPVLLRLALIRSGEAGKKQGVDFAAGGH